MRILMLLSIIASVTHVSASPPCASVRAAKLDDTRITFSQPAPGGYMLGPGGISLQVPAFCRIAGTIAPTPDSAIRFEVWLPEANWNGKYRAAGNGGFAGSINYADMAAALRDGYATSSTDTGHSADGISAGWALGHPEKIVDFGYRAIHETTEKAKAIIQAYYGEAPKRSYFASCSNGGRQALMEAQRYPADFDGILAWRACQFLDPLNLRELSLHFRSNAEGQSQLHSTRENPRHRQSSSSCLRRARRPDRRHHYRTAQVPFRTRNHAVLRKRKRLLPYRAASR